MFKEGTGNLVSFITQNNGSGLVSSNFLFTACFMYEISYWEKYN